MNEVCAKALNVDIHFKTKVTGELWRKCGRLKDLLRDWTKTILIPIYKKGQFNQYISPHCASIISEKDIESIMAAMIRKRYKLKDRQLSFQRAGIETVIIRHIDKSKRMKIAAVPHLESAYDTVRKEKKHRTIRKLSIDRDLLNVIRMTRQSVQMKTERDNTETIAEVSRGVCQGSLLSASLFNVYMDTYIEWLSSQTITQSTIGVQKPWNAALFADDMKMRSNDAKTLHLLLSTSF